MKRLGFCIQILTLGVLSSPTFAQETATAHGISIELNAAQTVDTSCTLTFLIANGLDVQVDKAVYETVLFAKNGQVNRLTLFDFGELPPSRPRVRQFAVPGITCDQLGRILFNGANTCDGTGLANGICITDLALSSRIEIEVRG